LRVSAIIVPVEIAVRLVPVARTLLLVTTIAAASAARAAVFQVGFGGACYAPDPQYALDAAKANPGPDIIALTRSAQLTGLALSIDAHDVTIVGGFNDCALSSQGERSVLDGAGGAAAPVLAIAGTANVVLEHVEIRGGDVQAGEFGGGVRFVGAGRLEVRDSAIEANVAGSGGGIAVVGVGAQTELVLGADTRVSANRATADPTEGDGGGVLASQAKVTANAADLVIADNEANGYGGGIRLVGAVATLASGGEGDDALLTRNRAGLRGGGLSAVDSSVQMFTRDPMRPTRVAGNRAPAAAGIESLNGNLAAWDVVVEESTTSPLSGDDVVATLEVSGTAQFVRNLAAAGGAPTGAVNCATTLACNRFEGNRVVLAGDQAAGVAVAFLMGGVDSFLLFEGATIRGNTGLALTSASCFGTGACTATLLLRASTVSNNSVVSTLFDGLGGGDLELDLVTLAHNTGSAVVARAGGSVAVRRSIVWQPGWRLWNDATLRPGETVRLETSLIGAGHGVVPLPGTVTIADPRFVAPASRNFRLGDDSPAVDYAAADAGAPDAALLPRNLDHAATPNLYGPLDLGAYELDRVFRDGFESPAP